MKVANSLLKYSFRIRKLDLIVNEGGGFIDDFYFRYPMLPPKVRFLTKILHPNVSRHGDVGIDIIQHNWSIALTVSKVLLSLQSLLTDPFTEVKF